MGILAARIFKRGNSSMNKGIMPALLTDQGSVRLCYDVLNADGLQIDNGVGEVRPANKGCINTTVNETTTLPPVIFRLFQCAALSALLCAGRGGAEEKLIHRQQLRHLFGRMWPHSFHSLKS